MKPMGEITARYTESIIQVEPILKKKSSLTMITNLLRLVEFIFILSFFSSKFEND